jgi:glycosyltransferase involved in cell wall biosynthesis
MASGGGTLPPVRVLWLIKGLGPGGAERLLVSSAAHVDRDRFEYEACYLLPWKDHLADDLRRAGVPVTCLDGRRAASPGWVVRLRRLVRDRNFALVHAHLPYASLGARLGLRGRDPTGPALVYTEHNTWDRYRPTTRWLNAATFARNDAVIAVSDAVAGSIRRRDPPPLHVIPNGVDGEALRREARTREEARAVLGVSPDRAVIGTVGGITPKKGHPVLVRAARRVVDERPDAQFVFVGLSVEPGPVKEEISRLGLHDHVTLAGYRADAPKLMPAFDLYCLPSLFEGLPVSLLEAMALGLPSVATAVGGVPGLAAEASEEAVVVVPPGDPDALATTLVDLLGDPGRRARLGKRGAGVAGRHSLAESVRRTERVYLEVLEARVAAGTRR